jgi:hypothetical protein
MYQLNPGRAFFKWGRRNVPVNLENSKVELAASRVGPWHIHFGFGKARKGDVIVLKMGGAKPVGIFAIGQLDETSKRRGEKHIWFTPDRKATTALSEDPIPFDWVRANLPSHMGNLVDVKPGWQALAKELAARGVAVTERTISPPVIGAKAPRLSVPADLFVPVAEKGLSAEGRRRVVEHVLSERNRRNRMLVLRARTRPYSCDACGLDFGSQYGDLFADLIEVHHLKPVSHGERTPKLKDFALLCANCHAVAHWRTGGQPRSLRELRSFARTRAGA